MTYKTLETIHDLLLDEFKKSKEILNDRRESYNSCLDADWHKSKNCSDDLYRFRKSAYEEAQDRYSRADEALDDFLNTDFH